MDIHCFFMRNSIDISLINKELEKYGLIEFSNQLVSLSQYWFEDKKPSVEDKKLAEYCLRSGNYGITTHNIENKIKELKGKRYYLFSRMFPSFSLMKIGYPVLNIYPLLLPFFYIWRLISKPFMRYPKVVAEIKILMKNMLAGVQFYTELIDFNGFILHASAVAYKGKAYLFSADSGTGKSTHTALWQAVFGSGHAVIINDDKPAIRVKQGQFFVHGTPFSGKHDISENISVPLGGIAFLVRSHDNYAQKATARQAIPLLLKQTIKKITARRMEVLLNMVNLLVEKNKLFLLHCSMEKDAVEVSFKAMSEG